MEGRDGFLGNGWFADRVWLFDYPGRTLALLPDGTPSRALGGATVPLAFKSGDPRGPQRFARLRVAVDGGGCSGFQYRYDLIDAPEADDVVVERDGAAAVVDMVSLTLLTGSEIDFVDELAGAEFRVKNPNAKSSCGCGVSFSI